MSKSQAPSPRKKLIKASAGSGKTYRIAKEYIKYILNDPKEVKSILAITFTNKAAAEMKERILNFLKGLSGNEEMLSKESRKDIPSLRESMKEELKIKDEELKKKATEALDYILYSKKGGGYSDFSVMTIDSFTNSMTKAFSYELNIPPEYGVGLNVKNIIAEAVNNIISSADSISKDGEVLLEYLMYRTDEGKSIAIESEIQKVAESIRRIEKNFPDSKVNIPKEFKDDLKASLKKLVEKREKNRSAIMGFCKEIIDFDYQITKSRDIDFENYKYKKSGFLSPVLKFINDDSDDNMLNFDTSIRFNEGINDINNIRSKDSDIMKGLHSGEILEEMRKKANELKEYLQYNLKSHLSGGTVMKFICTNLIYDSVREYLDEYQKENEIIFIDELNERIKSLFGSKDDVPFIYFKIGENFRKYMIDEFQDTSEIQSNNLKPLIDNAVASDGGSFTGVGDLKQAIYRFRGGSTEVMEKAGKEADEENLNSNYRSDRNIIALNNYIFEGILDASPAVTEELKNIYRENVTQKHRESAISGFTNEDNGGYIEVYLVGEKETLKDYSKRTDFVFNKIEDLLERGYSQSDIGVLTRTTKESNIVASQITGKSAHGQEINVISADSLFINKNPYVDFIVTLIRSCSEPQKSEPIARALYLWKEIAKNEETFIKAEKMLTDSAKSAKYGLGSVIDENLRNNVFREMFTEESHEKFVKMIESRLNKYGIYEAMSLIIEIIINPLCKDYKESMAHISRLKESAYKLMKEANAKDFLEYFDEYGDDLCIASPANENAVTISTIHKSKGLQYNAVIVPFVNWNDAKEMHKSYLIYDNPEIAVAYGEIKESVPYANTDKMLDMAKEERAKSVFDTANILYVALTRAKHELYVATVEHKEKKPTEEAKETYTSADKLLARKIRMLGPCDALMKSAIDETNVVKIGKKTTKKEEKGKTKKEVENRFDIHTHEENLFIDRKMHCVIDEEKECVSKRERGIILHEMLAGVKRPDDIERAVERALKRGLVSSDERNEYKKRITEIVLSEEFNEFFGEFDKVYTERELVYKNEVLRADRVMIKGKSAIIVDYKTGEEKKKNIEQVENYVNAYRELGYDAEGWLAYVNESRKVKTNG
ncbi:MAG: UvrD-helicase domain-containing protein [bacterium]|nr:UvrD-helicase domain-containing protein [bacterium]